MNEKPASDSGFFYWVFMGLRNSSLPLEPDYSIKTNENILWKILMAWLADQRSANGKRCRKNNPNLTIVIHLRFYSSTDGFSFAASCPPLIVCLFLGLLVSISFLLRLHLLGIVSPINKEKRRRQRNIGRPLLLITDHQPIAPLDSPLVSLGNGGSKVLRNKDQDS